MSTVQGLDMVNMQLTQFIKESTAGTYNANGERIIASSARLELQPEANYETFKPNGFNGNAWNAITREHAIFSGPIKLDYLQIDFWLSMLCGDPVTDEVSGDVRTRTYEMAMSGPNSHQTYTIEHGPSAGMSRSTYALLQAITFNFARMVDNNESSATILARKPTDGVTRTGTTTQDTIQTITITGTPTGGNFTLSGFTKEGEYFETGTIAYNASAANVVTALEAELGAGAVTASGGALPGTPVVVTFAGDFNEVYVPLMTATSALTGGTSPTVTVTMTQAGSDGVLAIPPTKPILPQSWSFRRASTLAGLSGATALTKMSSFNLTIPDQILLLWHFDQDNVSSTHFVDNEYDINAAITIANDTSGTVADLVTKARQVPATPEWWEFRSVHPDTIHKLKIQGYFSCMGNIPYANDNNVRYREFPMRAMLNDEGFLLRFTTEVAAETYTP